MPIIGKWRAHLPRAGTALLRQDPNPLEQRGTLVLHRARGRPCRLAKSEGLSGGCPHLAGRLSSPPLECARECAHLVKAEQPCNLGYVQLGVIKITNRQIAAQLLKYLGEVQPFASTVGSIDGCPHTCAQGPEMRKQHDLYVVTDLSEVVA